jgi:hypothetical protein
MNGPDLWAFVNTAMSSVSINGGKILECKQGTNCQWEMGGECSTHVIKAPLIRRFGRKTFKTIDHSVNKQERRILQFITEIYDVKAWTGISLTDYAKYRDPAKRSYEFS